MSECCTPETPVKRIDVTNLPPDFWRSDVGTNQPDNINDYDQEISHNGPIVVGGLTGTPGKMATIMGDLDVYGQIDPNSIVFSDAPSGTVTAWDSVTQNFYKIGVIGTQRPLVLMPITDDVVAVQTRKADGTTVVTSTDTLNRRFAINNIDPKAALDVNGAVIHWQVDLANFAANAVIGTAAATVDIASVISIPQTTANVSVTLPAPTLTRAGRLLIIENTGTTMLIVNANPVLQGTGIPFVWSGSAWIPYGASAVDFWRSGTGATLPDGTTDTTDNITHNGNIGLGIADPTTLAARLDVSGSEVLRPVTLANFAANASIGTAALTVDIASTLIIPQTTQNIVLSLPNPTKTQAGRLLIVKNTGKAAFSMIGNKVWPGNHAVYIWDGGAWRPDKHAPYIAPIQFNANLTLEAVRHHYEILESTAAGAVTVTVPNALPVGFQVSFSQIGTGRIIFVGSGGMAVNNRWGADRTAGIFGKCGIEVRAVGSCILSGDVV